MRRKPDYLWYKLSARGEERFAAIKETVKKYNPEVKSTIWYKARMELIGGIAPAGVMTIVVNIDGHPYKFSQQLHFDGFETSLKKGKGYVTKAKKSRELKSRVYKLPESSS